jgi:DNA-binding LytR/AlgR family response regulator
MRILIVDDEAPARERLRRFLADVEGTSLVGEACDGRQAVELIERERPDLVLLDIQMPGLDGFGVLEALDEPPQVIFVTAYDQYAIHAFEIHALDYLLKPFTRERLAEAVGRARDAVRQDQDVAAQLRPLLEDLAREGRYVSRLAVRDRQRIRVIRCDEIDWIGVEGEQTVVHAGGERYPIRRPLANLEKRLDPARFFRAHRSAIVNLDRVREIIPWFKGAHRLRLTTGEEIDLSRARARALRRRLRW